MVTKSVASSSLSSNDILSLAQILEVSLQYRAKHNSPFKEDYFKELSAIAGLGFTIILVDGSFISSYQPHLASFISHLDNKEMPDHASVLTYAVANIIEGAAFHVRFNRAAYCALFVKSVEEMTTHVSVHLADKIEEAERLLKKIFQE